jgi:hypothetical protein
MFISVPTSATSPTSPPSPPSLPSWKLDLPPPYSKYENGPLSLIVNAIRMLMATFLKTYLPKVGHPAHADPSDLSFDEMIDWVMEVAGMFTTKEGKVKLVGNVIRNMADDVKYIVLHESNYVGIDVIPASPKNGKEASLVKDYEFLMKFYTLISKTLP